jgi:solute carrier family 25 iron transporter 28/37
MAPTHIEILQPKERHVGRGEWEEQKEKRQQHEEDQRMAARHELHDGLSFPQYMLAGSVAGMVEHMAMFPVDLVKTRMQMLESAGGFGHRGVYKAFFAIVKKEGPMGLYRGIGAMGLGAGPAHAVYFAVYETVKQKLGGNRVGHHPLLHAMAGACATVASDAVFTPMDVVKQRLQLRRSPYRGVFDCMQRILKEEGVHAFYKSYPTTILMNIPFTAVHFAAYEAGKKVREESQYLEAEILLHLLFSKSNTEFWEQ